VGKKHLMDILEERRKRPFESFEDLRQRVRQFSDPPKSIVARIMQELGGNEKYYIFTPVPHRHQNTYI
jgi:putative nucleotide binding protein